MAEGQNTNQNTPNSQGSGGEGEKLIFGKYKSIEEAEQGYKELERKYHQGNERFVQMDQRLQALETRGPTEVDEGYGRGERYVEPQQVQNTEVLTRFYANPQGVLQEIEERAVQKAEQRIMGKQRQAANYQERVATWAAQNPDVAVYGDLLAHYVQQTDARLTPETRLDQAAEKVRKRVIELKGKPNSQETRPEDFVDGATSAHAGEATQGGTRQQQQQPPQFTESVLKQHVAERNARARKPLNHGGSR